MSLKYGGTVNDGGIHVLSTLNVEDWGFQIEEKKNELVKYNFVVFKL